MSIACIAAVRTLQDVPLVNRAQLIGCETQIRDAVGSQAHDPRHGCIDRRRIGADVEAASFTPLSLRAVQEHLFARTWLAV